MKRRDFLLRSSAVAMVAALPVGAGLLIRRSLLDEPQAWVGDEFVLPDGTRLLLDHVAEVRSDAHSVQSRLQFTLRAGTLPREGCHELRGKATAESLFLQAGRDGPVACINRLRFGQA